MSTMMKAYAKYGRKLKAKNESTGISNVSVADMPYDRLQKMRKSYKQQLDEIEKSLPFGDHIKDPTYRRYRDKLDAVEEAIKRRDAELTEEVIKEDKRYYADVRIKDGIMEATVYIPKKYKGKMVFHSAPIKEHITVLKAKEVIKLGRKKDLVEMLIKRANGDPTALLESTNVVNHLKQSDQRSLALIEAYISKEYPRVRWPWERKLPEAIRRIHENRGKDMSKMTATQKLRQLHESLMEAESEEDKKVAIINLYNDLLDKADNAVSNLANIAKMGVEAMASADIDSEEAEQLRAALGEPLDQAVDALSHLMDVLKGEDHSSGEMPDEFNMDDFGGEEGEMESPFPDMEGEDAEQVSDEEDLGSIEDQMGEEPEREIREK
ncbi:MAG: hypothetical protein D6698_11935 [Gammaproteobacteria bacterium]|nr:MAG: hypothetical protein D6698_11935 [Gammaproteobacteria bacterium]